MQDQPRQGVGGELGAIESVTVSDVSVELSALEIGMEEVNMTEVGAAEVSALEVGAAEVGVIEVGALEVGAAEIGVLEAGAAEIGVTEVGVLELGALTCNTVCFNPQSMLLQDPPELLLCDLLHRIIVLYSAAICTESFSSGHSGCRINQGRASGVNLAP